MAEEIIKEDCKEYLKCILTEQEKKDVAEKMAIAVSKVNEVEGNLKSVQAQMKADINRYEAEVSLASEKYRSGFEMRNIDCIIEKNYRTGVITQIRKDTFEIVWERSMTSEECQKNLFEGGKDG